MDNATGPAPLRVNLRGRRAPVRWRTVPRMVRYPAIIVAGVVLVLMQLGLDRLWPGAGVAFGLGLRWIVALGYVTVLALLWRARDGDWVPVRWRVFFVLVAAWFLANAAFETYEVLG